MLAVKNDLAKIVLVSPVCTSEGERIALSRRVDKHWRFVSEGSSFAHCFGIVNCSAFFVLLVLYVGSVFVTLIQCTGW